MDFLVCPVPTIWEERRNWFESTNDSYAGQGSYLVGEQACALTMDVQATFCAGAWVATIALALAVVDAQLRETELPGHEGDTRDLIDKSGANPSLQRVRRRRNALMHLDPERPAVTVDDQWSSRMQLEDEAREAVRLMFEAFYMSPGT